MERLADVSTPAAACLQSVLCHQPYGLLKATLQDVALSFRPRLSYMFALNNWKDFSNHTTGARAHIGGIRRGVSLEGVHDQVRQAAQLCKPTDA